MTISRSWFLFSLTCGLAAAAPAAGAEQKSVPRDPDIVVTAVPEEQLSDWKRAETEHVVVFSNGGERELARIASALEQLDALMTRLYRVGEAGAGQPKLQVILPGSRAELRAMGFVNARAAEGPFPPDFSDQRFYDPRIDGDVLAVARDDQSVDLNTKLLRDWLCDAAAEAGADCTGQQEPFFPPVARSWEAVLYSAFAQRFILSHVPAAYPRWYLDGVGALFSTVEVRQDGSIEYARPPDDYEDIFRSYGEVNAREVLTGTYLDTPSRRMVWTPYHAWLITHYFVFSNPKPARQAEFARYMADLGRGVPAAEAATVFGDLGRLTREIKGYARRSKAFARTPKPGAALPLPPVTRLTHVEAIVEQARFRLGDDAALAGTGDPAAPWIDALRTAAAQQPDDLEAMLAMAEAECWRARATDCQAEAERALSAAPRSARALAWKGVALTQQAMAAPADMRGAALAGARDAFERALVIDPQDPVAAMGWFRSFAVAEEPIPDAAVAAVAKVAAASPAAPWPRLLLGEELVRRGQVDLARRLLQPVLFGAYDSPEKKAAQALFAPAAPSSVQAGG